ncbi:MAG: hypothetical protein JNM43_16965 [Planctomycetaceae bacterium]|nr:hypothetical protein [Planctomycetaceae bacterium]
MQLEPSSSDATGVTNASSYAGTLVHRMVSDPEVAMAFLAQELGEAHTEESLRWWTLTVLSVLVALTSLQLDKPASQPERTKRKAALGLATTAIDQLFMDEVPWEPGMWRNPVLM